ncbi:Late expression factor 1 [Trabala vishnou gigantina nucleopolyhedrovirus]|uniref:Late expression factor 1 n=1 Tax=Trabala vishnou gigantina nucleopolyhedrovirus TaxID=2863583 RepID=UPI0024819D5A|nr:Late expression factor 1 [Trabala vishnou gigantina nucleopolyhedrovirus]QYC92730.1 Late expression factor 1 [Trabala vishnou gigantina nucleopolyhedrovirus]
MFRGGVSYTETRARLMWDSIAFNDSRPFCFFDGKHWHHPRTNFRNFEEFYKYLIDVNVSDVHVKALPDNGGREWVIDVDFDEKNEQMLKLKISVAHKIFRHFFGDNVSRIMYSGNRGIHVWLKIDKFPMSADKSTRAKYYKIFTLPKNIMLNEIKRGSFIYSVKSVIESYQVINDIKKIFKTNGKIDELIVQFWPVVDGHVFCNLNQIRLPFSYNCKGKKFSEELNSEQV